ncbi:hypothetical protein Cus16_3140 [Curtobacterium sp. ER1/6]|nr:hypothetical protein Cus16_3140 [Curtobacterium sp. ER1/6]
MQFDGLGALGGRDADEDRADGLAVLRIRPRDTRGADPPRRRSTVDRDGGAGARGHLARHLRVDRPVRREQLGGDPEERSLDRRGVRDDAAVHDGARPRHADEHRDDESTGQRLGHADGLAPRGQSRDQRPRHRCQVAVRAGARGGHAPVRLCFHACHR